MENLYIFIELTENLCSTFSQKDALDVTNELVEIGKSKICFNFNNRKVSLILYLIWPFP